MHKGRKKIMASRRSRPNGGIRTNPRQEPNPSLEEEDRLVFGASEEVLRREREMKRAQGRAISALRATGSASWVIKSNMQVPFAGIDPAALQKLLLKRARPVGGRPKEASFLDAILEVYKGAPRPIGLFVDIGLIHR